MVRKRTLVLTVLVLVAGTGVAVASGAVGSNQCEPVDKTENLSTERLHNRTNASDYEESRRDMDEDEGFVLTGEKLVQLAIDEIAEEEPCGPRNASADSTNATTSTATPTATPSD